MVDKEADIPFGFELSDPIQAIENTYEILEWIGIGGNTVAYLALGESGKLNGHFVVIKFFYNDITKERKNRFLEEEKILDQLEHPAIMEIFDHGEYDYSPFHVLEYCPKTLRHVINSNEATNFEKLCYIRQLIEALSHLKYTEDKIIHRDIKPSNIFINGKTAKLGDFGLAKIKDSESSSDQMNTMEVSTEEGIPYRYPTPDLIKYEEDKGEITYKSDIFQLGLVTAELFTGDNPAYMTKSNYEETGDFELDELSYIKGQFRSRIATIIKKMIDKNPDNRPDPEDLIDIWNSILFDYAWEKKNLDGKLL